MDRDFNEFINRRHTNSVKYDLIDHLKKPADTLPLWVADMDFQAPSAVSRRLEEIARFGIYGYSDNRTSYFDAVTDWYRTQFHWDTQSDWIVRTRCCIRTCCCHSRTDEGRRRHTHPAARILSVRRYYHPK